MHLSEGFDFLGFHIRWKQKRGGNKWYVYFFIADRPVRSLKDKIRALTRRTSQADLRDVLIIRINQVRARLGQLLPTCGREAHVPHAANISVASRSNVGQNNA
jgi:hypothetical protein